MMTDNVDAIIITLFDDMASDADIRDYTRSIIAAYGDGRIDRAQILYREKFKGEFSIVVMSEDEILADGFFAFDFVPLVGENAFELTVLVDPKGYEVSLRINQLTGLALNLTEINHLFGHFIKILACDLQHKGA